MSCALTDSERNFKLEVPVGYWTLSSMPDFSFQDWIDTVQTDKKRGVLRKGLADKIINSLCRLPDLEPDQKCIVSYSGKDSQCVAMIAAMKYPKDRMELVFADTEDEWPETIEFQPVFADWLEVKLTVLETPGLHGLIRTRKFFPKPNQRWCTKELKMNTQRDYMDEQGYDQVRKDRKQAQFRDLYDNKPVDVKYPAPITMAGERWSESEARAGLEVDQRTVELLRWTHRPVLDWTVYDVWDFIFWMQSPYNPVYHVVNRVACAGCMYTDHKEFRLLGRHHPEKLKEWAETEEIVGVNFSPSKKFSVRELYAEMVAKGELGRLTDEVVEEDPVADTPLPPKKEKAKQKAERVQREVSALMPYDVNDMEPMELREHLEEVLNETQGISVDAVVEITNLISDLGDIAAESLLSHDLEVGDFVRYRSNWSEEHYGEDYWDYGTVSELKVRDGLQIAYPFIYSREPGGSTNHIWLHPEKDTIVKCNDIPEEYRYELALVDTEWYSGQRGHKVRHQMNLKILEAIERGEPYTPPLRVNFKMPHQYTLEDFLKDVRWAPFKSGDDGYGITVPTGGEWPTGLIYHKKNAKVEAIKKYFHSERVFWKMHWPQKDDLVSEKVLAAYPHLLDVERKIQHIINNADITDGVVTFPGVDERKQFFMFDFPMRDRIAQRGFVSKFGLVDWHPPSPAPQKGEFDCKIDSGELMCIALTRLLWGHLPDDHNPYHYEPYSSLKEGDTVEYVDLITYEITTGEVGWHPGHYDIKFLKIGDERAAMPFFPSQVARAIERKKEESKELEKVGV